MSSQQLMPSPGRSLTPEPSTSFLIKEALAYRSAHATEGISAADVARHMKVSHSLLRLRFRTICRRSVRDHILDARFAAVNDLLKKTGYSLDLIAQQTGFSSANMLSHAYKARFGHSIRSRRRKPRN